MRLIANGLPSGDHWERRCGARLGNTSDGELIADYRAMPANSRSRASLAGSM